MFKAGCGTDFLYQQSVWYIIMNQAYSRLETELWIHWSLWGFMVPLQSGIFSLQWSHRSSSDRQTDCFWQQSTAIWVAVNWRDRGMRFTPHWFLWNVRDVWSVLTRHRKFASSENNITNVDGGGRRWLTQTCLTLFGWCLFEGCQLLAPTVFIRVYFCGSMCVFLLMHKSVWGSVL